MDPTACWQRWLDAISDDDLQEAYEASQDLTNWLNSGGFAPKWTQVQSQEFHKWCSTVTDYDVVVGNIGSVYHGNNASTAFDTYYNYMDEPPHSAENSVVLFVNGVFFQEHVYPNAEVEA
jgi:hypothetical protein